MKSLTTNELFASGFGLEGPFELDLGKGKTLSVVKVLRYLPGKRLACQVRHEEGYAFAKIFSPAAKNQYKKELAGIDLLEKAGIPVAQLQKKDEGETYSLLFQQWLEGEALDINKASGLQQSLQVLGKLHGHDLIHRDLHTNNLLFCDNMVYVLDAGAIDKKSGDKAKLENLALLLAQLPPLSQEEAIKQKAQYEEFANIIFSGVEIEGAIKPCWEQRKNNYLKKVFRDCSEVSATRTDGLSILAKRSLDITEREKMLEYLKSTKITSQRRLLKDGNSAKVYLFELADRTFVVKEYINKDWLRKIRRAFRQSRAARSWYFSHLFNLLGIRAPKPIALIEQKTGPVVTKSWFVSENIQGETLLGRWTKQPPSQCELDYIENLFITMERCGISHGDMKASNILCDAEGLALIDFDGAREYKNREACQRALMKDKERFLQNWDQKTRKVLNRVIQN